MWEHLQVGFNKTICFANEVGGSQHRNGDGEGIPDLFQENQQVLEVSAKVLVEKVLNTNLV